ncbi:hypothetical protein JQ634_28415 [Bradyrhizobium sp. AUGA SZCCT0240]|uniref:hypothetical protein n=1 Tax=unclassified Bradyrhizobium TaxID=2631580 RepID=UPI001BAD9626|nr:MULTISPECIES: hypothetical protein [unclassified Bradyrhizobium]MBR1198978.1 hypothetical protein [Bradyrhizobium sp. AUGA SZCCT0158]MBR1239607.1 hypothetical protein [Bradyrhizobium sp. AUGA SZCCT0274]MBR1257600.1 hypothetical protein [Bradyrhizobium sp. AUGA SZCCT0240]
MATLFEYFAKDFSRDLSLEKKWTLKSTVDGTEIEVIARLLLNFDANAKYVAFYTPEFPGAVFPEAILMNNLNDILELPTTDVGVSVGFSELPDELVDGKDLKFAGRVFIYSERDPPDDLKRQLVEESAANGVRVTIRSQAYMKRRNQLERPKAFISHDALENQQVILPVRADVTSKDVYEYSPILADRVYVDWSLGAEEVARRLLRSLDA